MTQQAMLFENESDRRRRHQMVNDGWMNTLSGLGTDRDKRTGGYFGGGTILSDATLGSIYDYSDTGRMIAERPAEDMVREWVSIEGDGDTKGVLKYMDEVDARDSFQEALTFARVFGGAAIVVYADDGADEFTQPLNLEKIKKIDGLKVFDRTVIHVQDRYDDPSKPNYNDPMTFSISTGGSEPFVVHESRCIVFKGERVSSKSRARSMGRDRSFWGASVFTHLHEALRDFDGTFSSVALLMTDISQAVIKIEGLAEMLAIACNQTGSSSAANNQVLDRFKALDVARSALRMIPLDAETEDFQRVATPLGNVPEVMDRVAERLAGSTRMPFTMFMSRSAAGLNSTGGGEDRQWSNTIKAMQVAKVLRPLRRLIDMVRAAKDAPEISDGYEPKFLPLYQLNDLEKSEVRKNNAETDKIYKEMGSLEPHEITASRFGNEAYGMEIELDATIKPQDRKAPEPPTPAGPFGAPPDEADKKADGVSVFSVPARFREALGTSQVTFDELSLIRQSADSGFIRADGLLHWVELMLDLNDESGALL